MKVLLVSRSDAAGGAARAAYRLHRALAAQGHASRMLVGVKKSADPSVSGPGSALARAWSLVRPALANRVMRLQRTPSRDWRTPALFPSLLGRAIDRSDAEVVNLHWIGEETLSVAELGRIAKPLVWTMHDMWPFCGAEHYASDGPEARWRLGYAPAQRDAAAGGLDIDAWVWRRKRKHWRACQLVAPSRWLAQCARSSALMNEWPISVIPNPLDTEVFRPTDHGSIRDELGVPQETPLVLFVGATQEHRKGWDLLVAALERLAAEGRRLTCVVAGAEEPPPLEVSVPFRWLGFVGNDATLARLYAACDVTLVPSRQENLPQAATEAQACGCPVVGFAATGLPDAAEHQVTGFLAAPFDTVDLARGIAWVLENRARHQQLRAQARERALRLWSPAAVTARYVEVYSAAIEDSRR